MVEIKFRRKGEVVVENFEDRDVPESIKPAKGNGVDLTAYSVIFASFGRHGDEKAKELHSRAPGAIVLYKYEWRNGWGGGVLLPERFNSSRVRFYSVAEAEQEREKERLANEAEEQRVRRLEDHLFQAANRAADEKFGGTGGSDWYHYRQETYEEAKKQAGLPSLK